MLTVHFHPSSTYIHVLNSIYSHYKSLSPQTGRGYSSVSVSLTLIQAAIVQDIIELLRRDKGSLHVVERHDGLFS
jgi:hypothetical protein